MKRTKKIASLLLALIMIFSMGVTTFAAGSTGSITIEPSSEEGAVPVTGKTFKAYKILNLTTDGTNDAYTVPTDLKNFYKGYFGAAGGTLPETTDPGFDDEVIEAINNLIGKHDELFAFAKAALQAAKNAGIAPGTSAAEGDNAKISNLPFGYYVVEDEGTGKPISALMLDSVDKDITITLKADYPTVDKVIDGTKDTDDGTNGDVKYNNAAVGDEVPFKVTTRVPDMTGYSKYYFFLTDTLSKGLTYDKIKGVTITFTKPEGAGEKTIKTLTSGTDFTATCTENIGSDNTLKIVFKNFIQYNTEEFRDAKINVSYSATVNEHAVIGVAGNPNDVFLTYSNNPNTDESGNPGDEPGKDSPVGTTLKSETRTYVTGVQIIKVDPDKNTLTGAQFEISGTKTNIVLVTGQIFKEDNTGGTYWKLKDGSYTTTDPATPGIDTTKYEDAGKKYSVETVTDEPVTTTTDVKAAGLVNTDGTISFEGLSAGTYNITELKAPDGYNLLKNPVTVTIGFTAPAADANPANCTWSYEWKLGTDTLTAEAGAGNVVKIINNTGLELPQTGGTGTAIFYVLGSILVIGAAVLLITRRRMDAEK